MRCFNPSFMTRFLALFATGAVLALAARAAEVDGPGPADPRNIATGRTIPGEGYADQPYIVKTADGAWLCAITTASGREGASGQHVVSMRSADQGKTWEKIVPIESDQGPEASYVVLLKTPYGRVYAFYNYNTENLRQVKTDDGKFIKRVDSLGDFVFKYSDDSGHSWSAQHYKVPVREFATDRNNAYGGKVRFFWNVGRPLLLKDHALVPLHKVGSFGAGFFTQSEGAFVDCRNIYTEKDPAKLDFGTLPDGDVGLRTPPGGGKISEEQSVTSLSDGSLYCVYRTVDGWPTNAYSRDGGHTWTTPAYMTHSPGGPRVKHPRAANFVWACGNGKYLYWFHNHGGPFIAKMEAEPGGASSPYNDRNPAWVLAGVERDTPAGKIIEWSQPEILLYDDDPYIRMSYPDLVEEGGKYYITETQKNIARLHTISPNLLDHLFNQFTANSVARDGLILNVSGDQLHKEPIKMPRLPEFNGRDRSRPDYAIADLRAGFSLDFWFELKSAAAGTVLLDSRDEQGRGILVSTLPNGAVGLTMNDGRSESSWACDASAIKARNLQHMVIVVDGGPKIISFIVDGVFCDGGDERQFGWGRYSPNLRAPNGAATMKVDAAVRALRLYRRALLTSEAVGNFHAGL